MKKTLLIIVTVIGFVLIVGTAYAKETAISPMSDPDSMINTLDPSNAPAPMPRHEGLLGLTEEGLTGAAAGGFREKTESLIYDLDPSNAPAARVVTPPASRTRDNPDSFLYIIDPSSTF